MLNPVAYILAFLAVFILLILAAVTSLKIWVRTRRRVATTSIRPGRQQQAPHVNQTVQSGAPGLQVGYDQYAEQYTPAAHNFGLTTRAFFSFC